MKKRILSLIMTVLFVINSFPLSVVAENIETKSVTEVILQVGFEKNVSVENKEYDGKLTANVDCENVKLVNATTSKVISSYDVWVEADGEFESKDASASRKKVTVSGFRLVGGDSDKFKLVGNYEAIEKYAYITPKELTVTPKEAWIYYGQEMPASFEYDVEQPSEGEVNLNVTIAVIDQAKDVGKYDYFIVEQTSDNANYTGKLSEESKFEIREYSPENGSLLQDGTYFSNKVTLVAPESFAISTDGKNFSEQVNVSLEETKANEKKYVAYYLKNLNNGAISKELQHGYYCSISKPEIISAELTKIKANSLLGYVLSAGFVGNDNVMLTITVKGTGINQDTTVYLNGENEYSKSVLTSSGEIIDGIYYYTASFIVELPESNYFKSKFTAYTENQAGKSDKKDLEMEYDNHSHETLILDKIAPEIDVNITYHNKEGYVEATGTIKDIESGVNKIEYYWDTKSNNVYSNYEIKENGAFSVKLYYYEVSKEKYPYTLHLRVTDNAGNCTEVDCNGAENGQDTKAPIVTIEGFREKNSTDFGDCVNYLEFGNYVKDDVELVVKAEDVSETDFSSGIKNVALYDGDSLIKRLSSPNEDNEYVFVISKNTRIENMTVKAMDNCGFTTTVGVNSQITDMISNVLVVEGDSAEISFNTSEAARIEENEEETVYWYNNKGGIITVNVNDDKSVSGIYSGIGNVKITDESGETVDVLNDINYSDEQKNSDVFLFDTSKLTDGIHIIKVKVIDNAGNTSESSITVGVDKQSPEAKISAYTIVEPDEKTEGKQIGEKIWFSDSNVVTFRVDVAPDTVSGIDSIELSINDRKVLFAKKDILFDEHNYYVTVDTTDINYDNEHKYVVKAVVTDVAKNEVELSDTVYVDCYTPEINSFEAEKESSALDKILHILTFGVYSNDSLVFKADVSDDSEIENVVIEYVDSVGIKQTASMSKNADGAYCYKIPVDYKNVLQSDVVITAYDKFGKNVSNNLFTMIETQKPDVVINWFDSDGVKRNDGQVWIGSVKDIGIEICDSDSGIRNVDIKVNGQNVTSDLNGVEVIKASVTEVADKRDNENHIYSFNTDYFTEIAGKPDDRKYTVSVEATDNAGNVTTESIVYYVDEVSPNVDYFEITSSSSNRFEITEYVEKLEYGYYFKEDFDVNVKVSDNTPSSGLDRIQYRLVSYDNGKFKEEKSGESVISDGIASIKIPKDFKGQIFVKAFDNVGNDSGEITPKAFVVDKQSPEINISGIDNNVSVDANGNKLFTDNVNVTVTITDAKSGLKEIGYYQISEKIASERTVLNIDTTFDYKVGDNLGDGWTVTKIDENLVTEVAKTFVFESDDNDITLLFDATDNSENADSIQSEKFTVDKTAPVVNVKINDGINGTNYYNTQNKAEITIDVIERNFDENLIIAEIENSYNGNIPNINFEEISTTQHRAVVNFTEGDYKFDISGVDMGGQPAEVSIDYEKVGTFFVDETAPVVENNFNDFIVGEKENYLNTEKVAVIKITEHNLDLNNIGLKILKKSAGSEHTENGFEDVTDSMVKKSDWVKQNDTYTLSVKFDNDAVYLIEVSPVDLSTNACETEKSAIFEIDTTVPVVSAKNGNSVGENAVEFLDIYSYERKDEQAPTVEFTDVNFDYIKYVLTVYTPNYTNGKELLEIKPVNVYLDSDIDKTGVFDQKLFTLPDFTADGVYALELIAVDKAGNESVLNVNTYMRMVDSDVLAYIPNSNASEKTGWYSFQYENGNPISKRPDNFSDIDIVVLAKNDSKIDIVLRDYNGNEKNTGLSAKIENSIYGVSIYNYTLKADYFKDNYQDDIDVELYLSVKNDSGRIDLGKMHIDNIPPSCTLSKDLKSWKWFIGNDSRAITITNISERLDVEKCKVYDNGNEIDFTYSETENTMSFTLSNGWHNVGITLEDVAGNSYSIQQVDNIYIGYFWLWIIIISAVVIVGIIVSIIIIVRKKRYN